MSRIQPLLQGVVGSTAYGLAHEGSDIDRLGVFTYRTEEFFQLTQPKDSIVSAQPDVTWHEAAKALRLITSCNPTAMEALWLEEYDVCTSLGQELVDLRYRLYSATGVRNAYLGYATQQFRKLQNRLSPLASTVHSPEQEAKHARHLVRLVIQGTRLHQTGELVIRLPDPQFVRDLGEDFARNPQMAAEFLADAEAKFDQPGVLPEAPDMDAANSWLRKVRLAYLDDTRA